MTRIIAIDPGQNTGFTRYTHRPGEPRRVTTWERFYGTTGHQGFFNDLHDILLGEEKNETIVVCERFLFLHENRHRDKIDYTPNEYIGILKLFHEVYSTPVEWQNSSQACGASAFWGDNKKGNGGNEKIKELGLWVPGKPHGMDSLRHLLYYVSFEMNDDYFIQRLRTVRHK